MRYSARTGDAGSVQVLVDYTRGTRGRVNSVSMLKPLLDVVRCLDLHVHALISTHGAYLVEELADISLPHARADARAVQISAVAVQRGDWPDAPQGLSLRRHADHERVGAVCLEKRCVPEPSC